MSIFTDKRIVMTLDAGGTNFVFNAMKGGKTILEPYGTPSYGDNLDKCLDTMLSGFKKVKSQLEEEPVAISFAFPGPADYPNGIIGDLGNLPGFRGGIALGSMLQEHFNIPVFIQNDGDLYAYGEALGGLLPEINKLSAKKYKNLIGLTLGTGFGAGLVHNNTLIAGDNSIAGEVWLISNSISPEVNAEEGVSTRAIINKYKELSGDTSNTIMPFDIYKIATGQADGNTEAAKTAFYEFGKHLGDAIANLINLFDGIVVIGGGITGASSLYMPAAMEVLKGKFGCGQNRLVHKVYCLDDEKDKNEFLASSSKTIKVPFSEKTIEYDPVQKVAVATSNIDASFAISMGAYAYAINQLDK
ncbi:ROK family protein [Plebeiibacterium marinum]|uniref:ROK family protein n=1 Tax=Plebeiibacterium marinum TaxID=2992111 RepID=A0AAE3ME20_9BACT|nr:ROK family protein [Plebeiobacterium marinum]MCW3806141.1 ROK family protein [Plebeiobacterium marinum]